MWKYKILFGETNKIRYYDTLQQALAGYAKYIKAGHQCYLYDRKACLSVYHDFK
jgi:hypothetical protein